MIRLSRMAAAAAILCGSWPAAVLAQESAPIRLRARTFVPVANVVARVAADTLRSGRSGARGAASARHLLIQFAGQITTETLADLRQAGAVPLRYVPENALVVAVPATFNPSSIDAARWVGALEPADRVSNETASDLAAAFPSRPLTIVEFHSDATRTVVQEALAVAGTRSLEVTALPEYAAVIPTDGLAIQRLSEDDRVAWIYPAADDVDSVPSAFCDGLVRPEGLVANFAAMGDGWDGPGRGGARLSYALVQPSADLPGHTQLAELMRAMAVWSRHAAITWQPAAAALEPASVSISWGPADHGDGFPFSGGVLAHAFYPAPQAPEPVAGDIHFNDTFLWGTADPTRWDIFSVALHELGHSLGLVHSAEPDSVMYPLYRGPVGEVSAVDVAAVRSIYAEPGPAALPSGWWGAAVGKDSGGETAEEDGRFTVSSRGRDIWDAADEFRFVSRPLHGDGDVVARIDSISGRHRWAKAGLMIRSGLEADAAHAFAIVSRSKGLAFQRRPSAGGSSVHTDGGTGTAPQWLWLSRRGQRVTAYAAADGGDWRPLGADTIALPHDVLVGLAVTSHDVTAAAAATFSNVDVSTVSDARWTASDIGDVGRTGNWSGPAARLRVRGAGADIWDRADAFTFLWQPAHGDVDIVARLTSIQSVRAWSKAGVMIRGGLDPGAPHAFMLGSAAKGLAFQRRRVPGAYSDHTPGGAGIGPAWLKLTRRGDRIRAYRSDDGMRWTMVGSDLIKMGPTVWVGLAVSSHTRLATAEAIFEEVVVTHR